MASARAAPGEAAEGDDHEQGDQEPGGAGAGEPGSFDRVPDQCQQHRADACRDGEDLPAAVVFLAHVVRDVRVGAEALRRLPASGYSEFVLLRRLETLSSSTPRLVR